MSTSAEKIRRLNDELRATFQGGQFVMTAGVQTLGADAVTAAITQVRGFDQFTPDNDPHGEHDFGSFDLGGTKFFFKIDYYDQDLEHGSEDPSDPLKTTRVLTLMLASEY
jgi:uncharacterized protein DUF3768